MPSTSSCDVSKSMPRLDQKVAAEQEEAQHRQTEQRGHKDQKAVIVDQPDSHDHQCHSGQGVHQWKREDEDDSESDNQQSEEADRPPAFHEAPAWMRKLLDFSGDRRAPSLQ